MRTAWDRGPPRPWARLLVDAKSRTGARAKFVLKAKDDHGAASFLAGPFETRLGPAVTQQQDLWHFHLPCPQAPPGLHGNRRNQQPTVPAKRPGRQAPSSESSGTRPLRCCLCLTWL